MKKTEVYSWRVTSLKKTELENEARREGTTVSALLDRITKEWIEARRDHTDDEAQQARLHAKVRRMLGRISGNNPKRAERASATIRNVLKQRYGR